MQKVMWDGGLVEKVVCLPNAYEWSRKRLEALPPYPKG